MLRQWLRRWNHRLWPCYLPLSRVSCRLAVRSLLLGQLLEIIPLWSFSHWLFLSLEEEGECFCLENTLSFLFWFLDVRSVERKCVPGLQSRPEFYLSSALTGLSSSKLLFWFFGLQCLLGYFVCQMKTWPFMSSLRIFIRLKWNCLWRGLCSQSSAGKIFRFY